MPLGVPFIRHAQISPADAVASRDEPAERLRVVALAAHRDAANPRLRRGGFHGGDRRVERGVVARGQLQHADFVARAAVGERRRVPHRHRIESRIALDQRGIAESELGREQDLA